MLTRGCLMVRVLDRNAHLLQVEHGVTAQVAGRLAELGVTYNVGPELGLFYLKNSDTPAFLSRRRYFCTLSI